MNKVEPFFKISSPNNKHEEAISEFLKVPHTIEDTEKYWAVRAGFITGYEIAKQKNEAKKMPIDILKRIISFGDASPELMETSFIEIYENSKRWLEQN